MKKLFAFIIAIAFVSCGGPKLTQTIYTSEDIMYVDYQNLEITYETKPDTDRYQSLAELQEAVEEITAKSSDELFQRFWEAY